MWVLVMSTETATSVLELTDETSDFEEEHLIYLCSEDIAFCGEDLTGIAEVLDYDGDSLTCVVCADLDQYPCERCGV